jgi:hypothetical protein
MSSTSYKYERFTQNVIEALVGVNVHHQRVYVGRISQRKIKITKPRPANTGFWQGNLRGPLDSYQGGLRFESIGQFLGMLCMDAYELERQKNVAAFGREQKIKR